MNNKNHELLTPASIVNRKQYSIDQTPKVTIKLNKIEEINVSMGESLRTEPTMLEDEKTPAKSGR